MLTFRPGSYGYIAQNNLEVAFDNVEKHPSASGVYAQQAVETMLKQYLQEVVQCTDSSVLHTHNLRKLSNATKLPDLQPFMQQMWALTDAYFNTRYPGEDYAELTQAQAGELCEAAAAILGILTLEIEKFRESES